MEEFDELRRRYEATPRQLDDRLWSRLREGATATPRPTASPGMPGWGLVCAALGGPLAGAVFYYFLRVDTRSYWLLGAAGGLLVIAGAIGYFTLHKSVPAVQDEAPKKTEEQLILEQGPLVMGHLVRADERLWQPGAPPGRALLLFSTDPAKRFDRTYLDRLVGEIQVLRGGTMPDLSMVEVWRMVNSDKASGSVPVPAQLAGGEKTFLAALTIVPKWLDRGRLTSRSLLCVAHPKGRRLMQL